MIIRKLYKIESAHIVRNCVSERCSHSYHGHSGKIEVFLSANGLDNAGMIYDFGALKKTVASFIDMFDHSVHFWEEDKVECQAFFEKQNARWIKLPCNPTAENYAVLFRDCINEILDRTIFTNGEQDVICIGVRYHETDTGYAESTPDDVKRFSIKQLMFSNQTLKEATDELNELIKKE